MAAGSRIVVFREYDGRRLVTMNMITECTRDNVELQGCYTCELARRYDGLGKGPKTTETP
jgi:hypothetical protein